MNAETLIVWLFLSSVLGWYLWINQYLYSRGLERILDKYLYRERD